MQHSGTTGTARQPVGGASTDRNPRVEPTRVPKRSRVEVLWGDRWFAGTATSQRVAEAGLETRVLYDAAEGYCSHHAWHNLDVEYWKFIEG